MKGVVDLELKEMHFQLQNNIGASLLTNGQVAAALRHFTGALEAILEMVAQANPECQQEAVRDQFHKASCAIAPVPLSSVCEHSVEVGSCRSASAYCVWTEPFVAQVDSSTTTACQQDSQLELVGAACAIFNIALVSHVQASMPRPVSKSREKSSIADHRAHYLRAINLYRQCLRIVEDALLLSRASGFDWLVCKTALMNNLGHCFYAIQLHEQGRWHFQVLLSTIMLAVHGHEIILHSDEAKISFLEIVMPFLINAYIRVGEQCCLSL